MRLELNGTSAHILRDEPFHVHFWECTPSEFLDQIKSPRKFLAKMGVDLPNNCRIETTVENHDWLEMNTNGLTADNK
jgi:hypothetical protein